MYCIVWEDSLCSYFSVFILDDDNRIVLQPIDGHPDCQHDYINASYIDVRNVHLCTVTYMHVISSASFINPLYSKIIGLWQETQVHCLSR